MSRVGGLAALAAACMCLCLGTTDAWGALHGPHAALKGCLPSAAGGALKVIPYAHRCRHGELRVILGGQGATGATGPAGPSGASGAPAGKGEKGETGQAGLFNGAEGEKSAILGGNSGTTTGKCQTIPVTSTC